MYIIPDFISYRFNQMDIAVSFYLENKYKKNAELKQFKSNKPLYQSPKRDNVCSQCGQQIPWCVCPCKKN